MLQQTTVPVVKQRYALWLDEFPDIHAVAKAEQTQVLRAFEGLGYYARARHLHQTAQHIHQHGWPEDFVSLRKLPGLGDYTAKTIMSRCFKKPVLAFDVNMHRLFGRLYMKYPLSKQDEKDLEQALAPLQKQHNPAIMGQALMRFAQSECKKNMPACAHCLFSSICRARRHNAQQSLFPEKRKKKVYLESIVLFIRRGDDVLIEKREEGIGKGMYSLPRLSVEEFTQLSGQLSGVFLALKSRTHTYTHHQEKLMPHFLNLKEPLNWDFGPRCYFENEKKLQELPFMAIYRDILKSIEQENLNTLF